MIELDNVYKGFGKVQALCGVSFVAANGEITGLLGPNGAGKTTALRIAYTALAPDVGPATIDGNDVKAARRATQQRIGVLPHNHGLYARLTARENIRYYGQLHGMERRTIQSRTGALASLLGMDEILERRTAGFSQGEKIKVAIARALVHDPPNVILDEPTSGLDVMSTRAMREFIRGLRDEGRCVLFSSHIMQEVTALCDRIVVIHRGRVVAHGTPGELRAQWGETDLEEVFVSIIGSNEGIP